MSIVREKNIKQFYDLLEGAIEKFPKQTLDKIHRTRLPEYGVYFFFEPNETRDGSNFERVVRIGTHAASSNSNSTLYNRLRNHKGFRNLNGNHRCSAFRKLIGLSLINREGINLSYWGFKLNKEMPKTEKGLIRIQERPLEVSVSEYLHRMTFTVLEVPGPSS